MNALTLLSAHVVEEAVAWFDIGRLQRFWPATGGIENSNYFVQTSRGEYVLTLLERSPYAGDEFLNLLFALDSAGLPVPTPIPDRRGRLDLYVQGKSALLQPRLPGRHVLLPSEAQLESLGRLVARLHLAARPLFDRIPPHPRDNAWLVETAEALHGNIRYNSEALLRTTVATVTSILHREDVARLPHGVLHGDIFRDNVLFRDNTVSGIIDFHHAAGGTLLFDLAVIANDWCCDSTGQFNTEKGNALLRGYHSQRPLTRQELWFFSPFRIYAALAFWLSRLTAFVQSNQGHATRTKNPYEMENIVRGLLRGFEYIDERTLSIPDGRSSA